MDDQFDEQSVGYRFILPDVSLPSLQVIASSAVALPIFYNGIPRHNLENFKKQKKEVEPRFQKGPHFNELVSILLKESDEMVGLLKTPKPIEEILRGSLKRICEELLKCLHFFQCGLFTGSLEFVAREMMSFEPHFCVWHSNGTIDYQSTASNLLPKLSVSKLGVVQKFIIMCNLCMENELETFDLNSLPKNFSHHVNFEENRLVYYWIRRLKNELHQIPMVNFDSIDAEVAFKCIQICGSWTSWKGPFSLTPRNAFKYFWNRLCTEDQISMVEFLLSSENYKNVIGDYDHLLEDILSMMSWHQQHFLLSQMPDKVISNFCLSTNSPYWVDAAMWAWTHSKNLMTIEQFQTVVVGILDKRRDNEDAMHVLTEIWESAPKQLRNYAEQNLNHQIASSVLPHVSTVRKCSFFPPSTPIPCLPALKFLHKLLSVADDEFRKEIILSNADGFASFCGDPELFHEVLDLCLPDSKDQSDFKKSVVNSNQMNKINQKLMYVSKFNILKSRLIFYVPDSKVYQDYVEFLLLNSPFNFKRRLVHDEKTWSKLSSFIDDMYPSDKTAASQLKKTLITSLITYRYPDRRFGFRYEWENALNVLKSVFNSEELKSFKQMFLENLAMVYSYVDEYWTNNLYDPPLEYFNEFYELYEINFVEVVPWCLDYDEDAIRAFKNVKLPVNVFYKRFFHSIVISDKHFHVKNGFDRVDGILKWYMTEEQLKGYKLNGVDILDDLEILKENYKKIRRTRGDEDIFKKNLMWLFDDDEAAVSKFVESKKLKVSR